MTFGILNLFFFFTRIKLLKILDKNIIKFKSHKISDILRKDLKSSSK